MMVTPREAGRITYSTDIRNRKRISITEHQKAIITGSVLGDAGLYSNWSNTNYRLHVRQCLKQSAYVEWKYQALAPLVLTAPQYYDRTKSVWFRTISHPELTQLHEIFYQDGKKIIPENIAEYLANPVTIAVWFMDDGNISGSGFNLNTQSFTLAENQLLVETLKDIWGLKSSIHMNHGYPRLYVQARSAGKFADMVRAHILPELTYKLGCVGDPP